MLIHFYQNSGQFLMANGRMRVSGFFRSGLVNEKSKPVNPLVAEVARLQRENRRLLQRMEQLELLVDIQKKPP
jgi:hypothetical protein